MQTMYCKTLLLKFLKILRDLKELVNCILGCIELLPMSQFHSSIKGPKKEKFRFTEIHSELATTLQSDVYFSGDEIQHILQKAIATLPTKQQLVFNMKYFDELKYSQISEILNTSVGALKASYFHAVKKIETYIQQHNN